MAAVDRMRRYVSVREAAVRLSVSERSVRRLITDGKLPAVNVSGKRGGAIRIAEDDVEQWLWV